VLAAAGSQVSRRCRDRYGHGADHRCAVSRHRGGGADSR